MTVLSNAIYRFNGKIPMAFFTELEQKHSQFIWKHKRPWIPKAVLRKKNGDISPKKTYRWLTNTWKDAQHRPLLQKCKSKPQWDITSHLTPHTQKWPSLKSLQTIKSREGGEKGTLLCYWWEYKLIQPLGKTVWRVLKKQWIKPPYDTAIPLLGIYLEKTKIEKGTRIPLFIAVLFTIARTWMQPRCPGTDE